MVLGDGIRRNIAKVSKEERDLFIDAVKRLNRVYYSPTGSRTDFPAGHVSYWFKQDEIHQSTHVHGCPAFLPWHREMCNRYEALLRAIHPELSLHYWDWNYDPSKMPDGQDGFVNLFDSDFMGNADGTVNEGSVGEPLLSAGFYLVNPSDPDPLDGNFRSNEALFAIDKKDPSTWNYPLNSNPADPPKTLTRRKRAGLPPVGKGGWPRDKDLLNANTWEDFRDLMYGYEQDPSVFSSAHGAAHTYIGGNLSNQHISFRDPFVFLLHSNIDRLWAMWQLQPDHAERLDPKQVYNTESHTTGRGDIETGEPFWGILSPLEPWAGFNAQKTVTGIIENLWPVRPWFTPENEEKYMTALDVSVVTPPSYDTAPHSG